MTPEQLAARGVRVRKLEWIERDDGNRHCADDYEVSHDGWGYSARWFRCEVGHEANLNLAKAAAEANHAARICAALEMMEDGQ